MKAKGKENSTSEEHSQCETQKSISNLVIWLANNDLCVVKKADGRFEALDSCKTVQCMRIDFKILTIYFSISISHITPSFTPRQISRAQ